MAGSQHGPKPDYLSAAKGDPMEHTAHVDREIDARGLNCPLPILRTKKALNDMTSGQIIRITATDPASVRDFQAFCRQTGNELVEHGEADGAFWFVLRRR